MAYNFTIFCFIEVHVPKLPAVINAFKANGGGGEMLKTAKRAVIGGNNLLDSIHMREKRQKHN